MTNPWDPLPLSMKGDNEADPMFARAGKAVAAWELLEHFLSSIFVGLVTCHSCWPASAERAYGTVVSFNGRADMLTAAIDASSAFKQNASLKESLVSLNNKAIGFSSRRNQIAHGNLVHYSENGVAMGYFWMAPSYSARQHRFPEGELPVAKYRFGPADLDYYIAEFGNLQKEAMELSRLLILHFAEHPQSFERKIKQ